MRKTSAPAENRAWICSGDDVAGPSVATIFVLRRLRIAVIRQNKRDLCRAREPLCMYFRLAQGVRAVNAFVRFRDTKGRLWMKPTNTFDRRGEDRRCSSFA